MTLKRILSLIVFFAVLTACNSPEKARYKIKELGYEYNQETFENALKNGDQTAIDLFITSGFKPSTYFFAEYSEQLTLEEYEYLLSNYDPGTFDINYSPIGPERTGYENIYHTLARNNSLDKLRFIESVGKGIPKNDNELMKIALKNPEVLKFIINRGYEANKVYEALFDEGDFIPLEYVIKERKSIVDGEIISLDSKDYEVVRVLKKNGANLINWTKTFEDGEKKSLLEIHMKRIQSDSTLKDIFKDELEFLKSDQLSS